MRNRHPGTCYRCGEHCAAGQGHFERRNGGWRVQHATCAIENRRLNIEASQAFDLAMERDGK